MSASWSSKLEEHFGVVLPEDVRAWFDEERWRSSDCTDYNEVESPAELLNPRTSAIFGGMMPADTIPVLGNGCGDCLSLRFDHRGGVAEVICWQHETGEWWPVGKSFAEAVVLDRIRRLAEFDADNSVPDDDDDGEPGHWARWAADFIGNEHIRSLGFRELFADDPETVYEQLLSAGFAEEAVRGILCERALTSGLSRYCYRFGGQNLGYELGVAWDDVHLWLLDNAQVPAEMVDGLCEETGFERDALLSQDWAVAASHAQRLLERRSDLAWPYAVAGWAAERSGDVAGAILHYFAGKESIGSTSAFSDQWQMAVEGRHDLPKFAASRLVALKDSLSPAMREDPYVRALFERRDWRRRRGEKDPIDAYWFARGDEAMQQGDGLEAYRCYFNAGWDSFAPDWMPEILERLIDAARLAGSRAWEKIAARHRQSLKNV
jgi:hypothetical protein